MQAGRQRSCHPACYPTRDRGPRCQRSSHALLPPRHCTCGAGSCRAPYPGWHCGCEAASFQPPAPTPSPASPTKTTPAELSWSLLNPRRSRAFHAAHAPRQRLTQACAPGRPDGLRGVEHPASQAGKLDSSSSSAKSTPPTGGSLESTRKKNERCPRYRAPWTHYTRPPPTGPRQ